MNGTLSTTESPQPKQLLVPEESTARAAAADVIVAALLDVLGAWKALERPSLRSLTSQRITTYTRNRTNDDAPLMTNAEEMYSP